MIHKARIFLIRLGKVLPFIVCLLVAISYSESVFALATNNIIAYDNYYILAKPISFLVGNYFEYNLQMLVVLTIISIATETCIYNKMACGYLGVNLFEKYYFDFELEPTTIYAICMANVIVGGYLFYKGFRIVIYK